MCPKSFATGFNYLIGILIADFMGELPILCGKIPVSCRKNYYGEPKQKKGESISFQARVTDRTTGT
jgi:hypothetical protein